jgi:nuclear transcription Y subunit beta
MKRSLPTNAKIAKDAKETTQECVSEFISFVTSEASDKCLREKRKTINGDDLLWAIHTLGFDDYIPTLSAFLQQYREVRSSPCLGLAFPSRRTTFLMRLSELRNEAFTSPVHNAHRAVLIRRDFLLLNITLLLHLSAVQMICAFAG